MNASELLDVHTTMCNDARDLMRAKNHDYAGKDGANPFANFQVGSALRLCSVEIGILLRMSDKMSRLSTYFNDGDLQVSDETAEDALLDMINYAVLIGAHMRCCPRKLRDISSLNLDGHLARAPQKTEVVIFSDPDRKAFSND